MNTQITRAGGALAALAVGVGLALTPTTAQAAPSPEAPAATAWLASQVPDGGLVPGSFPGSFDYGLTLDFVIAFAETGTEDDAADRILDTFETVQTDYTTYEQYGEVGSQAAGATSKLATAVQAAGRDARSFGGHDLVAEVESLVTQEGPERGRISDISEYPDPSNGFGQSFAVRALSAAGSDDLPAAAQYLVKQQCDDGVFTITMSADGCGSSAGASISVDTTALAVEALVEARDAGYDGADQAIADAAAYLVSVQEDDGSFLDTGAYNTNTTGLAAHALALAGEPAAATEAADFVATLQLPAGTDDGGAIAYNRAAFDEAAANGISEFVGDQFRRATAQAVLGLQYVTPPGPPTTLTLEASAIEAEVGDTVTVTATGTDADDRPTGDVTGDITLESSVPTDTVDGNTVTFNSASPHTITATHTPTGTTASVVVEVSPAAATPGDEDGDDQAAGGGDASGTGGSAASEDGVTPTAVSNDAALPDAGTSVRAWQLLIAGAMIALGVVLVISRRRSVGGAHTAGGTR